MCTAASDTERRAMSATLLTHPCAHPLYIGILSLEPEFDCSACHRQQMQELFRVSRVDVAHCHSHPRVLNFRGLPKEKLRGSLTHRNPQGLSIPHVLGICQRMGGRLLSRECHSFPGQVDGRKGGAQGSRAEVRQQMRSPSEGMALFYLWQFLKSM